MSKILLKNEYSDFIAHCESLRSGIAIKEFINDIDRQYSSYNTNMLITMMEFIEEKYPPIKTLENLHEEEILYFKEEVKDLPRPQLHYLYSYICHLDDKIIKAKRSAEKNRTVNPMNSFSSTLSDKDHKKIHKWLLENDYIADIDFQLFKLVFDYTLLINIKEKIRWISTYNGKNNTQSLFHLLHILCSHEYDSTKKENFAKKILDCFSFNSPTTPENIRQNFYSWQTAMKVGYSDPKTIFMENFLSEF